MLVILFLGIGSSAFGAPKSQLKWMGHWKGEGKRQLLVEEVKKEFEFLNPDVEVNLVYDVDLLAEGGYYKWKVANTIAEMINSGDFRWDVVFLGIEVYNYVAEILDDQFWGAKHLVDFSTVDGFYQSHKGFIRNTPFYKQQTGGIFVGPFIEGLINCLWYNRAVARKIGLNILEEGMTTRDFLEYARKVSLYNKDQKTKTPFFNLSSFNRIEVLFEYIFKSQLEDEQHAIDLSYSEEKAQAFLKTLLYFEQLSAYQPMLNSDWRTKDFVQYQKDFLAGAGLFLPAGTYLYGHFEGNAPQLMQNGIPLEPPTAKYKTGLVGQYSNVWAVMKNSPNRELGVKLLQLWSEPKVAEKWVAYTKNPTGLKGNLSSLSSKSYDSDIYSAFVYKMIEKYEHLPMRYFRSPMYVFGPLCQITGAAFRENLALILEGKKGAREYFKEAMEIHGKSSSLYIGQINKEAVGEAMTVLGQE